MTRRRQAGPRGAPILPAGYELYADNHVMTVYGETSPQIVELSKAHHVANHRKWFAFVERLQAASS